MASKPLLPKVLRVSIRVDHEAPPPYPVTVTAWFKTGVRSRTFSFDDGPEAASKNVLHLQVAERIYEDQQIWLHDHEVLLVEEDVYVDGTTLANRTRSEQTF